MRGSIPKSVRKEVIFPGVFLLLLFSGGFGGVEGGGEGMNQLWLVSLD